MFSHKILVEKQTIFKLCRLFSSDSNAKAEILQKLFAMDTENWDEEKYNFLVNTNQHKLVNSYNQLKESGFSDVHIKSEPYILSVHAQTIKSRQIFYEDYCFNQINLYLIRHFTKTISLTVKELKKSKLIKDNENIFKHINQKYCFETDSTLKDSLKLQHIHYKYLIQFFERNLDMTKDEAEYNYKKYANLRTKSFGYMLNNLEFLKNHLNFSNEKIRKHIYVLQTDRTTIETLIKTYPKLGDVEMKRIVHTYPNILLSPLHSIENVLKCVQKYGYSLHDVTKSPLILLLKEKTVEERLKKLHNEDWLKPYANLPRALTLISTLPGLEKRRAILEDLNMKCVTVNLLSCTKGLFNDYVKHGRDKMNSFDVFSYLSKRLDVPFNQIKEKLLTHPFKRYVPLQQIDHTLSFLLEKHNKNQIYQSLQLVLYPVNVITRGMEKLDSSEINVSPCTNELGQIKEEFTLPLILYAIEKENNFSGYGIWENEKDGIKVKNTYEGGEIDLPRNGEDELDHQPVEGTIKVLHVEKKSKKPWKLTS